MVPPRHRDWLLALALLGAVFLAYRPAWNGQPVWDDDGHLTKPELRSAAGLVRIWTEIGATQQYYPLVHSVFWAEHRLFGDATPGYHLVNVLLHALSALLLVAVLRRLDIPGAWLAGSIFALHPVMVESVAWITELKNTLSGVFFLSAALAYFRFDQARTKTTYVLSLALFVCGLLSKSVIATFPGALLIVLWWRRGRINLKRDALPLLPYVGLGLVSGLLTAWVERKFIGAVGDEFNLSILDRCLIAGRAIWFYLGKLLYPVDLTFIYPRWNIDSRAAWQYLFPAAVLATVAVLWAMRGRSRAPLAVFLYFAVTLFPSLGFFNVYPFRYSFVADHFQYLATLGPIVGMAALAHRRVGRLFGAIRPAVERGSSGVVLAVLFLLSQRQSAMYTDGATLYRATIQRNPNCWMAHYNLGLLLAQSGRFEEAKAHYLQALAINPTHLKARINLGIALAQLGQTEEAVREYRSALAMSPSSAEAHYNLGCLLAETGRKAEAATQYGLAIDANPGHAEAHNNLAVLLADAERNEEAVSHYQKALHIKPTDRDTQNNLGILLAKMGRAEDAVTHFRAAIELGPHYAEAHNNLAIQLAKLGRTDEAVAHYQAALEANPVYLDALANLALALAQQGKSEEAMGTLARALALARAAGDENRAALIGQIAARFREVEARR